MVASAVCGATAHAVDATPSSKAEGRRGRNRARRGGEEKPVKSGRGGAHVIHVLGDGLGVRGVPRVDIVGLALRLERLLAGERGDRVARVGDVAKDCSAGSRRHGCAFLVAGRGLVQARCERRGGGRRASAACGGGYGPRSGDPAVSASTAARGAYRCSGVAVARLGRAAAPCGAAQRDEMAVIVNSRNACCAAVSLALAGALLRLGPEGASEALFCTRGVLQRQRGGYKRPMAKQRGLG